VQGYLDEISATHVQGWVRDSSDPQARVAFDVILDLPEAPRILAHGIADAYYPGLDDGSFGDARYGFKTPLPAPLSPEECAHLAIRPHGAAAALERAPKFQGYVDQRSTQHVSGWVRDRFNASTRVPVEAVLPTPDGEQILLTASADNFAANLAQLAIGDAHYGFSLVFPQPLSEAQRDALIIRPAGAAPLPLAPDLVTSFQAVSFLAMDIVNNCNLRCPFCLFDYSTTRTTSVMADDVFDSALRLLPFVDDAGFWLSCLHEPSLHPEFLSFIQRVPRQWRRKIMFTTNLAKRMPASYFAGLAESGVSIINLSIESMDPPVYEKFRKGARWPIFKENWDRLTAAWSAAAAPPRLRYIAMAYQSNLRELPGLVSHLREARHAWQIEIRHTYDYGHIPADFRQAEYLHDADWAWLAAELAGYTPDEVILSQPPTPPAHRQGEVPVFPLSAGIEWDGTLSIGFRRPYPAKREYIPSGNIRAVQDLDAFFLAAGRGR
jgi:pyruvate-formate lyase-activating enzyme